MFVFGVFSPTVCSFNIGQARPSYSAITNIPQPSYAPSNKVLAFHTIHDSLSGGAAHCGGSRHCLQKLLPGHGMCIIPFSIAVPNTFKDITVVGIVFKGLETKPLHLACEDSLYNREIRGEYIISVRQAKFHSL